jgi:hypothetical protein
MKAITISSIQSKTIVSILIDIGALSFIYLVPTISHILRFPVYLIEPMRLMLILALVHTNKTNAYLIALSMPLFSFLISGHPVFAKTILIAFELAFNVFLFYWFAKIIKKVFPAILLSILISKIAYYIIKFGLISMLVIDSNLISTPLWIQLVTMLAFSSYLFVFYKRNKGKA